MNLNERVDLQRSLRNDLIKTLNAMEDAGMWPYILDGAIFANELANEEDYPTMIYRDHTDKTWSWM